MASSKRRRFLVQLAGLGASTCCLPGRLQSESMEQDDRTIDVPWLDEVITPPRQIPVDSKSARSLLTAPQKSGLGETLDSIQTKATKQEIWKGRREELLNWWIRFLGYDPRAKRPRIQWEVLEETTLGGVVRTKIRYETHPGWPVEAYILHPKNGEGKLPAAVALHPTVNHSIDEPIGLKSNDGKIEGPRANGLHLARKGFVVLVPRNYLWPTNDRIAAKEQAAKWNGEQAKLAAIGKQVAMKGMAKMLYDVQIAIDILEQDPAVDTKRISLIGHSLGAKEALYGIAFDSRVRCAAASEGGVGIRFSNWESEWYLGSTITEPSFEHEHDELLGLAAPKPLFIVAGESADGDRGWPLLNAGQEIYSLSGKCRLGQYNHRTGHSMTEEAGRRMIEWLTTYG